MDERVPRKRLKRREVVGGVRFLTFSCYRGLPLFKNDAIKDRFVEALAEAREASGFRLCGYMVMPEHVHLLLQPGTLHLDCDRGTGFSPCSEGGGTGGLSASGGCRALRLGQPHARPWVCRGGSDA